MKISVIVDEHLNIGSNGMWIQNREQQEKNGLEHN
jgi:hypothetical protein